MCPTQDWQLPDAAPLGHLEGMGPASRQGGWSPQPSAAPRAILEGEDVHTRACLPALVSSPDLSSNPGGHQKL